MGTIKSGDSGEVAKVDKTNKLTVLSVQESEIQEATEVGDSYNMNSGLITLTNDSESGILYLKNNEDRDYDVDSIVVILGPSTGGLTTDTTRIRIYKNPTTGTLISDKNTVGLINSNGKFNSKNLLQADVFSASGNGKTITDGTPHIESLISPGSRVPFPITVVLGKGDSIAVSLEPNDSNTNMKVMVAFIGHLKRSA